MPGDVTQLLSAIDSGDPKAAEELLPLAYEELRRLAAHKMANEKPGQTLQATALVHEAWLRVAGSDRQQWRGREHFFSAAAESMRRILVENARRKQRIRHGGGMERVSVDAINLPIAQNDEKCLRSLTRAQLAEMLDLHESTVSRAVASKYALVPGGRIVALADFFAGSLRAKSLIKEWVSEETHPLTDGELVELLAAAGICVARRTVAKYRQALRILPSELR